MLIIPKLPFELVNSSLGENSFYKKFLITDKGNGVVRCFVKLKSKRKPNMYNHNMCMSKINIKRLKFLVEFQFPLSPFLNIHRYYMKKETTVKNQLWFQMLNLNGLLHLTAVIEYRKIPKIRPSKYKPHKFVTQKTLC